MSRYTFILILFIFIIIPAHHLHATLLLQYILPGFPINYSPGGMTSPLAVLSDAALYIQQMEKIEQMEQLNKLKLAAASPVSIGAGSYSLGCGYPSPYGTGSPTVPLVLVMPPLWNSAYAAAGQVAAGLNPYLSPAGTPSPYGHPPSYCQPQPQPNPRDSLGLVLNPTNLSTGSRSLGSTESEGLPLYVPTPEVTKQQQQLQPQSKPSTIVRNPTYQSVESPSLTSKVVMRQKKNANTLDRHFRRSLGYENPIIKKRPATIAYHEVDDHFEKVFGADEWQKLNAKRKKLNRHSVI